MDSKVELDIRPSLLEYLCLKEREDKTKCEAELSTQSTFELTQLTRQSVYKDISEVIPLESYDPPPTALIRSSRRVEKFWEFIVTDFFISRIIPSLVPSFLHNSVKQDIAFSWFMTSTVFRIYVGGFLDFALPKSMQSEKHFDLAIDFNTTPEQKVRAFAAVSERDAIMSKRISYALKMRPNASDMLVIVGDAHIPGICRLLIENYQFGWIEGSCED